MEERGIAAPPSFIRGSILGLRRIAPFAIWSGKKWPYKSLCRSSIITGTTMNKTRKFRAVHPGPSSVPK